MEAQKHLLKDNSRLDTNLPHAAPPAHHTWPHTFMTAAHAHTHLEAVNPRGTENKAL